MTEPCCMSAAHGQKCDCAGKTMMSRTFSGADFNDVKKKAMLWIHENEIRFSRISVKKCDGVFMVTVEWRAGK